jgi:hypothetical protein
MEAAPVLRPLSDALGRSLGKGEDPIVEVALGQDGNVRTLRIDRMTIREGLDGRPSGYSEPMSSDVFQRYMRNEATSEEYFLATKRRVLVGIAFDCFRREGISFDELLYRFGLLERPPRTSLFARLLRRNSDAG